MSDRATGSQIELDDIGRVFRSKAGDVQALRGVSFAVPQGQILGLLGENGAGKTTLLKILSTLLLPTTGRAAICGHDVVRSTTSVRKEMAVVFGGERGLYTRLSGRDNLRFFATIGGLRGATVARRIGDALDRVGLSDAADRAVETYSRGMRQRLHIAIGTLTRPSVLLLDEPTIGLDPSEAQRLRATVREFADAGVAIVLTSHHLLDIEMLADRVCLLRGGQITHDAPLASFMKLADKVGVVVITGVGRAPDAKHVSRDLGATGSIAEDSDGWTLRIEVSRWSGDLFARLTTLCSDAQMRDVRIEPFGLEHVYTELMSQPTGSDAALGSSAR